MTTTQDLSFPNRVVRKDSKRQSFENKLQNLIPRIGFLTNTPVLPKGNTLYDRSSDTLYYSNGTTWIPIANAAAFATAADTACDPDVIVVIEPSTFISGTDVGVALVPRGTGGVSLAAPDLTPAGGNCRGNSAVDLQIKRTAATQIASGTNSIVLGGSGNTASGDLSVAAGESAAAGGLNSICFSCNPAGATAALSGEFKIGLPAATATAGRFTIDNLPAFDDDAAAGAPPVALTTGMLYQTTGAGAIATPGVVMIKQ